jgi:type IV secretion system protein VirD4
MVSGCPPIRAKKARYYEDPELQARILPPPTLPRSSPTTAQRPSSRFGQHDWNGDVATPAVEDPANSGIRREPELPEHEEVALERPRPTREFETPDDESDDEPERFAVFEGSARGVARQASLDPADDMGL